MKKKVWAFAFILLVSFSLSFAKSTINLPEPTGRLVNDFAGILQYGTVDQLEKLLLGHEKATSNEVAIVTIKSLDGVSVEEYAVELFEKWGIGKKAKDSGVLFLMAVQDRKMRIEVGYGLEHVLTDGRAGEIIREATPFFKESRWDTGVELVAQRIINIASKSEEAEPSNSQKSDEHIPLWGWILIIVVLIIILVAVIYFVGTEGGFGGGGGFFSSGGGGGSDGGGDSGGGGGFSFGGGSSGGGGASGSW